MRFLSRTRLPQNLLLATLILLIVCGAGTVSAEAGCADANEISVHCGQTPSAHYDREGRLWVIFAQNQYAYVVRSDDHGKTFSAPVGVNERPETLKPMVRTGPRS